MPTECSAEKFKFGEVSGRVVAAGFDGGAITSDAGALRRIGLPSGAFQRLRRWNLARLRPHPVRKGNLRHDPSEAAQDRRPDHAQRPPRAHRHDVSPSLAIRIRHRSRLAQASRRLTRHRYRKPPSPEITPAIPAPAALARTTPISPA